jgi:hypothetical protein
MTSRAEEYSSTYGTSFSVGKQCIALTHALVTAINTEDVEANEQHVNPR